MHAVILHGGSSEYVGLEAAHTELCDAMVAAGWTVDTMRLAEMSIGPCVGCFACWQRTPGECCQQDDGRVVNRAQAGVEVVVLLTPVSFGGYGSTLKYALDRIVPNISPLFVKYAGEMHHRLRYAAPRAWLSVGWLEERDAESIEVFTRLLERNALNAHAPWHQALVFSAEETAQQRREAMEAMIKQVEERA